MKKTVRFVAAAGGFLLGAGAIGGLEMETMDMLPAVVFCLLGILIFTVAILPPKVTKSTFRAYDSRDEDSHDELAERRRQAEQIRKSAESWKSIKEANK